MKCPKDRKTEMVKSDDFVDFCPHCGAEKFAWERCVRGIMKRDDLDFSLPLKSFIKKYDGGDTYNRLITEAWKRKNTIKVIN